MKNNFSKSFSRRRWLFVLLPILVIVILVFIALEVNGREVGFAIIEEEVDQSLLDRFRASYDEGLSPHDLFVFSDHSYDLVDKDSQRLVNLHPFLEFDIRESNRDFPSLGDVSVRMSLLVESEIDDEELKAILDQVNVSDFALQVNLADGHELYIEDPIWLAYVEGRLTNNGENDRYLIPHQRMDSSADKLYRDSRYFVDEEEANELFFPWFTFSEVNRDAIRIYSDERAELTRIYNSTIILFSSRFHYKKADSSLEAAYPFTAWAEFSIQRDRSRDSHVIRFQPVTLP